MRSIVLLLCIVPLWAAAGDGTAPSVLVQLTTLHQRVLKEKLTAYGRVSPDPDAETAINATHPVIVERLAVTPGQRVAAGEMLLVLATAPEARMAYRKAVTEVEFAREDLKHKRQLRRQQLATRSEVAAAEKALKDAESALQVEKNLGNDRPRERIRSPFAGIVTRVSVSPGARVPAGGALLNLTNRNSLIVALGVEPAEAYRVQRGDPVTLTPIFGAQGPLSSRIARVHGTVDPSTRLVDAVVRLDGEKARSLLPGMELRGEITISVRRSLAVPRTAVLTDSRGSYLFVVRDGVAHRIGVTTNLSSARWIGVAGPLQDGDRVVVEGNYELRNGAAVREARQ